MADVHNDSIVWATTDEALMYTFSMLRRISLFLPTLCALLLLAAPLFTLAQTNPCKVPGTRPAIASDDAVKRGRIEIGRCYNPDERGISQVSEAARSFLEERACGDFLKAGVPTGKAPACPNARRPLRIDGLDPKFAECVVKYITNFEGKYGKGTICVHDAYRGPGEQQCASNSGARGGFAAAKPGTSRHEKGQAVDLNPRGVSYTQMREFADQTESGIWYRYKCSGDTSAGNSGKSGPNDCPHLETKTAACADGSFVPPNTTGGSTVGTGAPTSGLTNALRGLLGQQTQQTQQQTPFGTGSGSGSQGSSQGLPSYQTQSTLSGFSPPSVITNNANTNTNANSNFPTSNAAGNQLEALAFGTSSPAQVATTVPIVIKPGSAVAITSNHTDIPAITTQQVSGGSLVSQTFVSQDLNQQQTAPQTLSTMDQRLSTLKSLIAQLITILTPFGSRAHAELEESHE